MGERWIKLYEKTIVSFEWHTDPSTLSVFIHLLLMVSPDGISERGDSVPIGSERISIGDLSRVTGLDHRTVSRALANLVSTECISVEYDNGNKHSRRKPLVTVQHWSKYQQNRICGTKNVGQNVPQSEICEGICPTKNVGQNVGETVCGTNFVGQDVGQNVPQTVEKESFTKEKEFIHREDTLSCVPERAQARAEQDTHTNEFSNFTSSIDPYPRTAEEVKQAAMLQGIAMTDEEARAFLDYNASVGWMARGEPIRKWKALLNGWHQNQLLRARRQKANGNNGNNANGWRDSQGRWNNKVVAHDGDFGEPEPIAE